MLPSRNGIDLGDQLSARVRNSSVSSAPPSANPSMTASMAENAKIILEWDTSENEYKTIPEIEIEPDYTVTSLKPKKNSVTDVDRRASVLYNNEEQIDEEKICSIIGKG